MAGRIPQWFIDDLLNRVDVVEVIDSRVPLKKAGHEYKACCPFHSEKTPSFTVSPSKQFYHCFGCGAHGTAVGFLMDYEHMDFVEAIESLAAHLGIEVPREDTGPAPQPARQGPDLYLLLEQVSEFYRQQLKATDRAILYLKGRGVSGEIAAEYALGYAPPGWDTLLNALGEEKRDALLESGMLSEGDHGRVYDRFRERIMFPIRDRRGRIIAFGGRIFSGGDGAKYLNSPETPVFHKGRELYGLYEARQAVRKLESMIVVEGYMDVIALAQHGVRNVVATLGTATTPEHLKQLFRIVPEVTFCFDGDRAGRDAAWRALENALPTLRDGRTIRFLFLPEGEDPDSLVREQGKIGFERQTLKAQPFEAFFFERLSTGLDLDTAAGRSRLAELAKPLLLQLPGGVFHEILLEQLAEKTGLNADRLAQVQNLEQPVAPQPQATAATGQRRPPVRHLITLLLQRPELAQLIDDPAELQGLEVAGIDLLSDLLGFLHQHPQAHLAMILEHWRDHEYASHLFKLARSPIEMSEHRLENEFRDVWKNLLGMKMNDAKRILAKIARGESPTEQEKAILQKGDTATT